MMATFTSSEENDVIRPDFVSAYVISDPVGALPSGADDTFFGSLGTDLIDGGLGFDTIIYDFNFTMVEADLGSDDVDVGGDTQSLISIEAIVTGGGADTLQGTNEDNFIRSGDGNDTIHGRGGDDWLLADAGDDRIDGGDGNDTIAAGLGDDTITGGAGIDSIDGGGGRDKAIYFESEDIHADLKTGLVNFQGATPDETLVSIESISSGSGNDDLRGTGGANVLDAGPGDDVLRGRGGDDALSGGSGTNRILGNKGRDTVDYTWSFFSIDIDLGRGKAFYRFVSGLDDDLRSIESVIASGGDDEIRGSKGRNEIFGGVGADILRGLGGADRLDGGVGNDKIIGGGGADHIVGAEVEDVFEVELGGGRVEDDDTINAGSGPDRVEGGYGNDKIKGGDGDDVIAGEYALSIDEIPGDDVIDGGRGDDVIWGTAGEDILRGGPGDDRLWGDLEFIDYGYSDRLFGGGGDDMLDGGAGDDILRGGPGDDTLHGIIGDDKLFGEGGNDKLFGDPGEDMLDGGAGRDRLAGGGANDLLIGGPGRDRIDGGQGLNDTASYRYTSHDVTVDLRIDRASVKGDRGDVDRLAFVERMLTGRGDDRLFGDSGPNSFVAGGGGDRIFTGPGDDVARGGAGDDVIDDVLDIETASGPQPQDAGEDRFFGDGGDDMLFGGFDSDWLEGGPGQDGLFGDQGGDRFVFRAVRDSRPDAADTIGVGLNDRAFDRVGKSGGDVIDLSRIDADKGTPGDQAFVFGQRGSGGVWLTNDGGDTLVNAALVGDDEADLVIRILDGGIGPGKYSDEEFIL